MSIRKSRSGFVLKATLGVLAVAAVGGAIWAGRRETKQTFTTFTVRHGPLDIKVVEGGEIKAIESQEIKSQIKGYEGTKILYIVDEGSYVTEEDVKNKKKLVELDSSSLHDKLTTAQITFKNTQSALTEAEKGYDIDVNQAESDIYAAKLDVTFAEMAMSKYLGTQLTGVVMKALDELQKEEDAKDAEKARVAEEAKKKREAAAKAAQEAAQKAALDAAAKAAAGAESGPAREAAPVSSVPAAAANPPAPSAAGAATDATGEDDARQITLDDLQLPMPDIDFSDFAMHKETLGDGEASQQLMTLHDTLLQSRAAFLKAQNDFASQKRLFDQKFITPNELQNFQIALDKSNDSVKAAETAERLFINFQFKKDAQKLMADYVLATRKQHRTEQQALSRLAQGRAKLLSARGQYKIESDRIKDWEDQIDKCVMVAERSGLVVYGSGNNERYWNNEPIKEGASVREKQAIITIPDMTKMAVKVNIHESDIKKISIGLRARIRVDAFPDRELEGEVTKVAVLPDSENRWMNPDLKVYETMIKIDGTYDWLKPGMSAQAEVLVKHLDEVTYIPIQSVVPQGDKQVCFVVDGDKPMKREIETGEITVEYIAVNKGLKAGEKVLIRPPDGSREEQIKKQKEAEAKTKKKDGPGAPKPGAAPAAGASPAPAKPAGQGAPATGAKRPG